MGCGDLRNPLATIIGTNPNQYLHIHINDISLLVIARNILILKIVSNDKFDLKKEADMSYIWDLWYNATWPQSTLKRFVADVEDLLHNSLPHNIFIPESTYHDGLKAVWSEWVLIAKATSLDRILADR